MDDVLKCEKRVAEPAPQAAHGGGMLAAKQAEVSAEKTETSWGLLPLAFRTAETASPGP